MVVMNQVEEIFCDECSWQFKTNRWNCTDVTPPIYSHTGLQGKTLGKALLYARMAEQHSDVLRTAVIRKNARESKYSKRF